MTRGIIRSCPQCSHGTEKSEGCNHITCCICKNNWCWLCGKTMHDVTEHYLSGQCAEKQFVNDSEAVEDVEEVPEEVEGNERGEIVVDVEGIENVGDDEGLHNIQDNRIQRALRVNSFLLLPNRQPRANDEGLHDPHIEEWGIRDDWDHVYGDPGWG